MLTGKPQSAIIATSAGNVSFEVQRAENGDHFFCLARQGLPENVSVFVRIATTSRRLHAAAVRAPA